MGVQSGRLNASQTPQFCITDREDPLHTVQVEIAVPDVMGGRRKQGYQAPVTVNGIAVRRNDKTGLKVKARERSEH